MSSDDRRQLYLLAAAVGPLILAIANNLPGGVVPVLVIYWTVIGWFSLPALLAGIALALPFYHAPFETTLGSFIPSELMLLAALGAAGLSILIETRGSWKCLLTRINPLLRSPLIWVASALAFLGLVLSIFPAEPAARAESLREWRWVLFEPLLFVMLLVLSIRTRRETWLVAGGFLAGALVASLSALIDPFNGGGVSVEGLTRVEGFFPHPNALALYLLRATVFLAFLTLWRFRRQPVAYVPLAILAAALGGSFARSALLTLAIFALIATIWMSRRLRLTTISGMIVAAAGLLIFARDRMLGGSDGGSQFLRIDIWQSGLAMIRDSPVTGYGPDQFLYVYAPRYIQPSAWAERFTSHAHNIFIDAWIRLGIGGEVIIIGVATIVLWNLLRVIKEGPAGDSLSAAAILALGAAFAQGLVDNGFFSNDLALSAWLLAWVAFAAPNVTDSRRDEVVDARSR